MASLENGSGHEAKPKKVRVPEKIKFFETMDDEFRMMDEKEILNEISSKYPGMSNFEDNQLSSSRETMLEFFSDGVFIEDLLWWYDINFTELFRILYGDYVPLLSSTTFIRKVKKVLLSCDYLDKPVVTNDEKR